MVTGTAQEMFAGGEWRPREAQLAFGGRSGSDSGIGRVGRAHVMHSFTELQTIVLTPADRRS